MSLTMRSGYPRSVVGAALNRAVAGFWARMTVDAGDTPETAGVSAYMQAHTVAGVAMNLVRQAQARNAQQPEPSKPSTRAVPSGRHET